MRGVDYIGTTASRLSRGLSLRSLSDSGIIGEGGDAPNVGLEDDGGFSGMEMYPDLDMDRIRRNRAVEGSAG